MQVIESTLNEMKRVLDWIQGFALSLGGPGLFLVAFLDSSFLSFPEVTDVLIVWLTTRHEHRMVFYATFATSGSVAGCFALYLVARKGGEAFLRKRFHGPNIDRAMQVFQKYGLVSVVVASLLPPPMPFKIFVFLSGVARVRHVDFLIAVAIGRSIRYFGEGYLALVYGDTAIDWLHKHARTVSLILAATFLVGGIIWMWWRRRGERRGPESAISNSLPRNG
jgi:membrane protein YqaA with SNARE-associated domain